MANMTIKPAGGFQAEVEVNDGSMILGEADTIELMQNANAAGYSIRVEMQAAGYSLNANIKRAALELAGLESYQAAKATRKGYIEF